MKIKIGYHWISTFDQLLQPNFQSCQITYNDYIVGELWANSRGYFGEITQQNGIFQLQSNNKSLGFILILSLGLKQIFNEFKYPMDWIKNQAPFHLDSTFLCSIPNSTLLHIWNNKVT